MKKSVLLSVIVILSIISNAQTLDVIRNGNLRSGSSTNYEIIGKVTVGMQLKQLEYVNDWYHVEMPDKTNGWVFKSLVSERIISNDETKKLQQILNEYIVIITIPNYKCDLCPFFGNKIIGNYLFAKLLEFQNKYNLGEQSKAYVCPQGVFATTTDNIVIYKSEIWFDILETIYTNRGTFPKIEIKNSNYDLTFMSQGKKINLKANSSGLGWTSDIFQDIELKETPSDILIDEINIIYNEGMEVRFDDIVWIFKNGDWVESEH